MSNFNNANEIAVQSLLRHKRRIVRLRVLSVLMCITAFITTYAMILPAITATGAASSDLAEFLDDITFRDSEGNTVDGNGTFYIGDNYAVELRFSEKNDVDDNKQFKYNDEGYLTFQMPPYFDCITVENGVLTDDDGNDVGTYTIDSSGLMKIRFDDGFIEGTNGASLRVQLSTKASASVSSGSHRIEVGDYTVDFDFSREGELDAEKEVSSYDLSTHTVNYEVKVKAKHGDITGISYSDVCSDGMSLVEGSERFYSLDKAVEYASCPTDLPNGEGFIAAYSMKIDDSVFKNKSIVEYTANNTITVSGTNGEEHPVTASDDAVKKVESEFLHKSGRLDRSAGENTIRWTLTVGDGYSIVDGLTLHDVLGGDHSYDKSKQVKFTPYHYDSSSGKLVSGTSIYTDFPEPEDTLVLPIGQNALRYTVTYYTTYETNANEANTYTNAVSTEDPIRGPVDDTASVKVDSTGMPPDNIVKDVELSADGSSLHYTVGVNVYGSWYNKSSVYLSDVFTSVSVKDVRYFFGRAFQNISVKVTDLDDETEKQYTRYDSSAPDVIDGTFQLYSSNDPRENSILFNTASPSRSNSTWKEQNDVRLTVEYDIPLDTKAYTRNNNGEYIETDDVTIGKIIDMHRPIDNTASFYYNSDQHIDDSAQYRGDPTQTLYKQGDVMSSDTIDYTVTFDNYVQETSISENDGTAYYFSDELLSPGMSYKNGTLKCYTYNKSNEIYTVYVYNGTIPEQQQSISIPFSEFVREHDDGTHRDLQRFCNAESRQTDTSSLIFCYTVDVDKSSELFNTADTTVALHNRAQITGEKPDGSPYYTIPADHTVDFPNQILDKSYERIDDSNKAKFTIRLNPNGVDLVEDADEFILVDTMTENLTPIISSISVKVQNDDTSDYAPYDPHFTYDKANGQLRFRLPDGKPIIIEYDTIVTASGDNAVIGNKVELEGISSYADDVRDNFTIQNSAGAVSSENIILSVLKQGSMTHEPLENAVFALYGPADADREAAAPEGIEQSITRYGRTLYYYESFTTGTNGYLEIERNKNNVPLFFKGGLYALVEASAPEGYVKNGDPLFFYAQAKPENAVEGIPSYVSQYPVVITNEIQGYELPATGSFGELAFIVIGAAAMSGAVLTAVILRRKKLREE